MTVAATNIGGWKRDPKTKLHYTETPNANGQGGIWGLAGVYKDMKQANEDIRISIAAN